MCQELEKNRRILAEIIFARHRFTAREIFDAYKSRTGFLLVDGVFGVEGYMRHLHELGVLEFKSGKYTVQESAFQFA